MFFITLCVLNKGFDFGWNFGILDDILANRFVRSYGGMSDVQVSSLAGALSLILFFSSLMYISGRQTAAALLVVATVVASISTRAMVASNATAFDDDGLFYLILDIVLAIPFCFSVWLPSIVRSSLEYDNPYQSSFMVDSGPESITGGPIVGETGDELSNMRPSIPPRPTPPRRRQKKSYSLYEIIFLIVSLFSWPFTIGTHIVLATGIRIESINYTGDISAQGLTLLLPLYIWSAVCTWVVIWFDKEARSGKIYAKEKLAYHESMDLWLEKYKAQYGEE